jgi:hypothetical protein
MGVTDATRDAAAALNSGAIQLLRGMRAVDRESGLTPARLSALSVLVFGGPRGLGALARAEGVAGPTMTRIVDGLVAAGLAERRPHPADGRGDRRRARAASAARPRAPRARRTAARRHGVAAAGRGAPSPGRVMPPHPVRSEAFGIDEESP